MHLPNILNLYIQIVVVVVALLLHPQPKAQHPQPKAQKPKVQLKGH
jgi:hypothetical protein